MKLLKQMVEIYSPTGEEENIVEFLIKETGGKKDEAGNFILGEGDIMLVGHLDTVPGQIKVEEKDGKLYGRGSVDAKGAMAVFVEAKKRTKNKNVMVVGCVDEEGDSKGAKVLLGRYKPTCIIIGEPSGWQGITLGYKGIVKINYLMRKPLEHTARHVPSSKEKTIMFYNKIKEFCNGFNQSRSVFRTLDLAILDINSKTEEFEEWCKLALSIRIPPGFNVDGLKEYVKEVEGEGTSEFIIHDNPIECSKNNFVSKAFLQAIRKHEGIPRFKLKTGTSDMNTLQEYNVPMVAYGPGDSHLDHTPNEHLEMEEWYRAADVLTSVLDNI